MATTKRSARKRAGGGEVVRWLAVGRYSIAGMADGTVRITDRASGARFFHGAASSASAFGLALTAVAACVQDKGS